MPCPRCGHKDIMGSKVTILGKSPEVVPGVRTGDVIAFSHYCPKCSLLEESSTETPDELARLDQRWDSVPELEQSVVWNETSDPFEPCVATVDGQEYVILMRVPHEHARAFYEVEAAREAWSVRELQRQIGALLFEGARSAALPRHAAALRAPRSQSRSRDPDAAPRTTRRPSPSLRLHRRRSEEPWSSLSQLGLDRGKDFVGVTTDRFATGGAFGTPRDLLGPASFHHRVPLNAGRVDVRFATGGALRCELKSRIAAARSMRRASRLDDPGEVFARTTVHVDGRREGHEDGWQPIGDGYVVEDVSELLHHAPCQEMIDVDRKLHPPEPILDALTDAAVRRARTRSPSVRGDRRRGPTGIATLRVLLRDLVITVL